MPEEQFWALAPKLRISSNLLRELVEAYNGDFRILVEKVQATLKTAKSHSSYINRVISNQLLEGGAVVAAPSVAKRAGVPPALQGRNVERVKLGGGKRAWKEGTDILDDNGNIIGQAA